MSGGWRSRLTVAGAAMWTAGLLALVVAVGSGCRGCADDDSRGGGGGVSVGPNQLRLIVAYGSEKKSWMAEQVTAFEASGAKVASGKRIKVDARAMGSGEVLQAIASGALKPHVFSPASGAYVTLLNDAWMTK